MLADVRREMLVRTMRLLDLAVLSSAFLLSLAMSSGSFSWTSFSEILFIRIALHNLLLFAAFLAFSAAIFWGCGDRKSTRLNSSHTVISYAVFCLKKKNKNQYLYS